MNPGSTMEITLPGDIMNGGGGILSSAYTCSLPLEPSSGGGLLNSLSSLDCASLVGMPLLLWLITSGDSSSISSTIVHCWDLWHMQCVGMWSKNTSLNTLELHWRPHTHSKAKLHIGHSTCAGWLTDPQTYKTWSVRGFYVTTSFTWWFHIFQRSAWSLTVQRDRPSHLKNDCSISVTEHKFKGCASYTS